MMAAVWAAPVKILIAYHSETGNTAALAAAVRDGAASVEGVEVVLKKSADVRPEEIVSADGVLIGTPVHWQTMSGETKRFIDRMAEVQKKPWGEGKTGGVFCTAGSASNGQDVTRLSVISALLAMRFVIVGGVNGEGYGTLGPQASGRVSEAAKVEARSFGERFARATVRMRR